jgi:hypothetical protein
MTAHYNAFNIKTMTEYQAENYRVAGRQAARAGTLSALMTIGTGAMTMGKIGSKYGMRWTKPSPSTFMVSDARVKENIIFKEKSKSGINIYEWNYLWGPERFRGVIAQEILESHPQAVMKDKHGYLKVRYDLLDVEMIVV